MHRQFIISVFSLLFTSAGIAQPIVKYTLSFEEPRSHYIKVQMDVSNWKGNSLELKMPVWTPGSYLVREFSRFVERFKVVNGNGNILHSEKFAKNGWRINNGNANEIKIEYYVYAYELSVRNCFVDDEHAYLNGAGLFLYINKQLDLPSTVEVQPYRDWKTISTSLDRVVPDNQWLLKAQDYDELIDAPMEIGNHVVLNFMAAGIPHELALFGKANYDTTQIKRDIPVIIEEEKKIFGDHPCKKYVFIIHNIPNGSGGLEHKNSLTIQVARNGYSPGGPYNGFLSLVAHEYFHLWNVKRLRPAPLGPFDYDTENYTHLLYVAEGFTAYYDDLIIRRCNFINEDLYLATVAGYINAIENTPGNRIQSLAESSFDAWIKYYRASENNINATISYYTKGALIAALLDFYILDVTNGGKRLDDVMRLMYDEYYKKLNRGYTDDEFKHAVEKISGRNMDTFFNSYIYNTDSIPYSTFFSKAGLLLTDDNAGKSIAYLGAGSNVNNGKIMINAVERNSPAWKDGLNVNDEILASDNIRMTDDLVKFISGKKPGDKIQFLINRNGLIKTIDVTLNASRKVSFVLKKMEQRSAEQEMIYKKWIGN